MKELFGVFFVGVLTGVGVMVSFIHISGKEDYTTDCVERDLLKIHLKELKQQGAEMQNTITRMEQ